MGQRTWHVHRWVLCKQSKYFEKALEGSPFSEEEVDYMLKYLYFHEFNKRQMKEPVAAYAVAEYFQVPSLCSVAASQLSSALDELITKGYVVRFKECCHLALGKHAGTQVEQTVINVLAGNIEWVMHESHAWDELTDAYPGLAKNILQTIHPKPAESSIRRPPGFDFKDFCAVRRDSVKRSYGAQNFDPVAGCGFCVSDGGEDQ
ncbi:hypothetical protein F5883DRAFT_623291 [Diaporthe sp. PMI_573]|nr:hypothetical protein F5883DRAFT_623291 [Diaporthaceae sp. PMI_573]